MTNVSAAGGVEKENLSPYLPWRHVWRCDSTHL